MIEIGSAAYERGSLVGGVAGETTVPYLAHWHAACTRPRHEKQVANQLRDRGIEFFLPLYRSLRRWKDRRKEIDLVLFPGYIFVRTRAADRLQVLQLPGVTRFVFFAGSPADLPGDDIEALRTGFALGVRPEYHPFLKAGRMVKVVAGPLSGARGILLRRKKNDCRLVISLEAIMRSVSVEIDEADVVPVF